MGRIKSYPGLTGPLCDGTDPEGNVFQLAQSRDPFGANRADDRPPPIRRP